MKTGKSIVELATELQRRAGAKQDFVAKTEALNMEFVPLETEFEKMLKLNVGDKQFGINALAHDQLGAWANIPAAYYDRMAKEQPDLLAVNVNTWLGAASGQKRMVRTLDGKARAFLSDVYRPLENEDLAGAILPVLLEGEKYDIMSCEVTDTRLYIKVVSKTVTRELAKTGNYFGDNQHRIVQMVAPAITISNSEVGKGRLSVEAGMFNSFCSNLATFSAKSFKRTHVGARHDLLTDEVYAMLTDETRQRTDEALWLQVRDVVRNAFEPEAFNALVEQVEDSRADRIDTGADVVKVVKLTGQKLGITENEQKGVLQALIEGADLSRFGLHNAVTAYSQKVDSYDRATELERIGAQVIELPKTDWQAISKAS